MYPEDLVMPMKAELTDKGFQDLNHSAEQVNDALKQPGTTLVDGKFCLRLRSRSSKTRRYLFFNW